MRRAKKNRLGGIFNQLREIRASTDPKIRLKRSRLKRVIIYHIKQKEAGAEKKRRLKGNSTDASVNYVQCSVRSRSRLTNADRY